MTALKRFGKYRIVREIGRGGQATVYEAEDAKLGRRVALKVLDRSARSDEAADRLLREARAVAKLDHPNIVRIYDVTEEKGRILLAMELVEGGTLAGVLAGRMVSIREAIAITERVARAAHHAHECGIIHRDIKPANVLVADDGTPKLTDFGLALDAEDTARLTRSGTTMGTPAYMSPEQIAGRTRELGPSTDVYSIGAALFVMLAGRPPFAAETTLALFKKIVNDAPPRPSEFRPAMPAEAETICLKCLAKAPVDRYPSAEALADDCARLLSMRAVSARRSAVARAALPFLRRHRVPAALAMICAVVALLLEIGTRMAVRRHEEETRDFVAAAKSHSDALRERERNLTLGVRAGREEQARLNSELARLRAERAQILEARRRAHEARMAEMDRLALEAAERRKKQAEEARRAAEHDRVQPESKETPKTTRPSLPRARLEIVSGKSAKIYLSNEVELEMVYVRPGVFTMGEESPFKNRAPDDRELPHEVEITQGFYIGRCEVTRAQYHAIGTDGSRRRGSGSTSGLPATRVKWEDAMAFCRVLSKATGRHFRLPTEAEWEYACRAGTLGKYSCGDQWQVLKKYAWFNLNSDRELHPVGKRLPNPWGIHDMHGNAAEWCLDWFDWHWYRSSPRVSPTGPHGGNERVLRGGSYWNDVRQLHSATRRGMPPSNASEWIGFRVVMEETPSEPLPSESSKPRKLMKVAGAFVEAEAATNAADLGGAIALDGASGGKVLRSFTLAGERTVFRLNLEDSPSNLSIALRVIGPDRGIQNLKGNLTASLRRVVGGRARGVASGSRFSSFVYGWSLGDGPKWLRLGMPQPKLPPGEYILEVSCKSPIPELLLDVAGITLAGDSFLPNELVDGVLKEGGYYIDTGRGKKPAQ